MSYLENQRCWFVTQKVKLHPNKPPTFLLLDANTNKKTVKLMQVDRLLSASRLHSQKHVPMTLGADSQTCLKLSTSQYLSLSCVMLFKLCLGGRNLWSMKLLTVSWSQGHYKLYTEILFLVIVSPWCNYNSAKGCNILTN